MAPTLALLLLLGFAASFAFFSDATPDSDDDDPPEGEEIIGSDRDDLLEGGPGNDLIRGGDGNDTLSGGPGNDTLLGEAGDDLLLGGPGHDLLDGGPGNDTLDGGPGMNTLLGGAGDDSFVLRDGHQTGIIRGGTEDEVEGDLIDAREMSQNTIVTLRADNGGWFRPEGRDIRLFGIEIFDIERFEMGSGFDSIDLSRASGSYYVDGGEGNDTIHASMGDDTLFGGAGDDTFILPVAFGNAQIHGGEGADLLRATGAREGLELIMTGDANGTLAREGATIAFDDVSWFELGDGDDLVDARAANLGVNAFAGGGDNTLLGGAGNDTLHAGYGTGENLIDGGDGDDLLEAALFGNSTLLGGAGDDTLEGSWSGSALLDGGEGDDALRGYRGDTLIGCDGHDQFIIYAQLDGAHSPVTVADYVAGQDRVTLELVPHFSILEPAILHEIDAEANEVRILAEGEVVAVLTGTTTFDPDDLDVEVVGFIVPDEYS